ncbi:MAG: hypothetical protein OSA40_05460, partial [Phycisphaerales bacterium]|nr:hypothetical protein [Phycisphaerales bacterium]
EDEEDGDEEEDEEDGDEDEEEEDEADNDDEEERDGETEKEENAGVSTVKSPSTERPSAELTYEPVSDEGSLWADLEDEGRNV